MTTGPFGAAVDCRRVSEQLLVRVLVTSWLSRSVGCRLSIVRLLRLVGFGLGIVWWFISIRWRFIW